MTSANEAILIISSNPSTLMGVQLFGDENSAQIVWQRTDVVVYGISLSRAIAYCTNENYLTAIDVSTGNTLWTSPISWSSSCSIGFLNTAEETVFYISDISVQAVFGAKGTVRWSFPLTDSVLNTLTVGADGTIYFLSGSHLFALNGRTGSELWSFRILEESFGASPISIGDDGTLFFSIQRDSDSHILLLAIEDIPDPLAPALTPPPSSSPTLALAIASFVLSAAALAVSCAPRLAHLWTLLVAPPPTFKANGEVGEGLLGSAYVN